MNREGYYTSGEFARKANVTLRTVRYYDQQGILKPSRVAENGYRLYTDADFAKLQKILSLKYLGFSLDEIMTMTINDDDMDSIKESIHLQLNLVQKKMEHLKMVEQSLKNTVRRMEESEEIDWNEVVELIHVTNTRKRLVEQYKNASNLDIRISLHKSILRILFHGLTGFSGSLKSKKAAGFLKSAAGQASCGTDMNRNCPRR